MSTITLPTITATLSDDKCKVQMARRDADTYGIRFTNADGEVHEMALSAEALDALVALRSQIDQEGIIRWVIAPPPPSQPEQVRS